MVKDISLKRRFQTHDLQIQFEPRHEKTGFCLCEHKGIFVFAAWIVHLLLYLQSNLYNSNFTNFLHSDWLFARLYTSIKAVRKNTRFSSENWRDVT